MSDLSETELRAAWDRLRDPMRPLSFDDAMNQPAIAVAVRTVARAIQRGNFIGAKIPAPLVFPHQSRKAKLGAVASIDLKRRASGEKDD